MSLDSFKAQNNEQGGANDNTGNTVDKVSIEEYDWHISMDKYWNDVDERFYGQGTPNEPPLMNVPEKLAADMEYVDDPHLASSVADQLDFNSPERYEAVITVIFNDFSTWKWPLLKGDKELTSEVEHFIDKYIPEIIRWEAIVAGEDPDEAIKEWTGEDEGDDMSWMEDIGNTSMSDDMRKMFNEEADWLPHINRTVETNSEVEDVEIDSDGDWTDDW